MKEKRHPLLVLAALLTVPLAGCHPQMPGSDAPPVVRASAAAQSQAERTSQAYIDSIQTGDYHKAEAMMSANFQKQTPPPRLKELLDGPDRPFLGAKGFQFDPAQYSSHGKSIVLRAQFVGGDGKPYRTNFLLAQSGTTWQVSGLIPPATHHTRGVQQVHSSAT